VKILVLMKQTPDTETKIKISGDQKTIESGDTKFIINPYDEFAVEEALKIKEKNNAGEVVIVSFGDEKTREQIVKALAMGADRGILVDNAGIADADSLAIAKILAGVIKAENPEIVFTGKQAIDDDNMHVGPMVAELLGWPHVNVVNKLTLNGKTAQIEREVEGGQVEVYEVGLPALFGANKSLNTPRYASLPGIMKAKKKPLDKKAPGDFGVDANAAKSSTKVTISAYKYPAQKPPGKIFKGEEVNVMVEKVVKLLREEAKVI
jgi:electron transfer flavoprotein beta subunit